MFFSSRINASESTKSDQTLLNEQLDWLTVDHDDLRQDLLERIATPKYHPSMAVIDQWEEEAIARIRHAAVLARRTLITALDQHALAVKQTLNTLTPKLRAARHGTKSFDKKDLQEWAAQLHELKQMPMFPVITDQEKTIHGLTIDLRRENRTHPSTFNLDESTSDILVSFRRDPAAASASISNALEHRIAPSILTNKTDRNKKKTDFDNTSSSRSHAVSSGEINIITKQSEIRTTVSHPTVRRTHTNIPLDSRTNYPLHGSAIV